MTSRFNVNRSSCPSTGAKSPETSELWRLVVAEIAAGYPDISLEHALVDCTAMQLIATPARFDIVVTENMFGEILCDETAMIAGSLGTMPSTNLGHSGPGLFEPRIWSRS